ncbi:plasmid replication protein RepC [Rhizobium lusitanum]|uniref:Replication initiation protein RepC n=1 Tax=Rhizobium lusitanum TaxID=293958 RepID=A0A7X0MD70_9HYPH|nr:plasmid replication protein RepC [Rhizobium lusitanum]MBB6484673.1 replication initiation protein RepC [Rhizobium lusitanum]
MEAEYVTTPFGRRPMTLAMLVAQRRARHDEPVKSVDKWKIYRALCEAKPHLGITDRALAVLNALLSFYPKIELSDDANLVVFPSNAQLSLRAHGMAEQTIRRHLAALVEAGLIVRRDSPNGKRYARRTRAGDLHQAYGFSLAPLLSRADEIEHLAAEVVAERLHVQALRERISLLRRDVAKLIETAIIEAVTGDWNAVHCGFRHLIDSLPRSPSMAELELLLQKLDLLHLEIVNRLEKHAKTKFLSANHYQNERHIQNSDSESIIESEAQPVEQHATLSTADRPSKTQVIHPSENKLIQRNGEQEPGNQVRGKDVSEGYSSLKTFPLDLVIRACPEITAYSPSGQITNWRDLTAASIIVRTMLEIGPGAHQKACEVMGVENTATVIACILQRTSQIKSAGAYLRDLTRRTKKGEFAIGPMLMSLLRANAEADTRKSA